MSQNRHHWSKQAKRRWQNIELSARQRILAQAFDQQGDAA
jgi:hypothetical protein